MMPDCVVQRVFITYFTTRYLLFRTILMYN